MADVGFLEVLLLCVEYGGDDFLDGHPEVKVMSAKQGRKVAQQAITYILLSVWLKVLAELSFAPRGEKRTTTLRCRVGLIFKGALAKLFVKKILRFKFEECL